LFTNAIVRKPGENFVHGLTSSSLGAPDYNKAQQQHRRYCEALVRCGLRVTHLGADLQHPDSTFVEDTAVLTSRSAILTRPGATSRQGEVATIREPLEHFFSTLYRINAPGTLEGGDVCQAENHFFIGLSQRTNEEGARQLAEFLAREGYTSSFIDIRRIEGLLHLKSEMAYIGDNNLVAIEALAGNDQFRGYNLIRVNSGESYAANCVRANDYVLLPAGYPAQEATLGQRGYKVLPLDVSEFQRMDGGLSCLSLRF
jgi:dimethylargininase